MNKIDFSDYKKKVDKLRDYSIKSAIIKRLLKNVIETGKEKKVNNIVYNYENYEGEIKIK